MRGFKVSRVETEIYKFLDGRSFISQEKQVGKAGEPGAHGGTHFLLYGKDKSWMREIIFRENREANGGFNVCFKCGMRVFEHAEEGNPRRGQWHHRNNKPGRRCDCKQNAAVSCSGPLCHPKEHPQVMWTKREEVQV